MDIKYKIILDKRRKKQDSIYPLKIRVFQNGEAKEQSLNIYIHEKDWDKKDQIILKTDKKYKVNSLRLNELKNKIDKLLIVSDYTLTSNALITLLFEEKKQSDITLKAYSDTLISGLLKAKRVGTSLAYNDARNSLIKYGSKQLLLQDINYNFLVKYNNAMLAKGIKPNSIAAYLRSIRAILNHAIKDKLISTTSYPFRDFKIKGQKTKSRALTVEEMSKIYRLPLPVDSNTYYWRDYFMLSFYLIGANFADLLTLRYEDFSDDRVIFRRKKTGKIYSIWLHPEARKLFDIYSTKSSGSNKYVLPELNYELEPASQKTRITQIIKNCNKHLNIISEKCRIDKKVTTYYARYTWANIARRLGYSKDIIAEALGHEYGNKVTGIYLDNYDTEVIDAVNRNVIESVLNFKS